MRLLALLLLAAALATACGTARRIVPPTEVLAARDPELAHGQVLFMQACNQCHPRGEAGVGPAINNKPLPAFLIRYQIRHGLGAMPAFPPAAFSEEEVTAIVRYLQFLHTEAPIPPTAS
ncbi:MAG TPA: cytochrome c [Falsiroseomonas sp.]|jgi:mono/diheme cytochrome c family protein|nr:cytochrome c [Falsiroseomonas sp.]